MSKYTRYASTNAQEESIAAVEKAFKKAKLNIVGGTTIGKYPQTVILDIKHQDGKVRVNSEGIVQAMADKIKFLYNQAKNVTVK